MTICARSNCRAPASRSLTNGVYRQRVDLSRRAIVTLARGGRVELCDECYAAATSPAAPHVEYARGVPHVSMLRLRGALKEDR